MNGRFAMVGATAALAISSVTAQAQNQFVDRASAPVSDKNEFAGQSDLYWILGVAAVIAAVVVVSTESDDDPVSP